MSAWFEDFGYSTLIEPRPDGGQPGSLLIGAYPRDHSDVSTLANLGVHRVLSLCEDGEYERGERKALKKVFKELAIEESRLPFEDYGEVPAEGIERAVRRLMTWLGNPGGIYLHCRAGQQRSATVAAALLCRIRGCSLEKALREVGTRRPDAEPLDHQRIQLYLWFETVEEPARESAARRVRPDRPDQGEGLAAGRKA